MKFISLIVVLTVVIFAAFPLSAEGDNSPVEKLLIVKEHRFRQGDPPGDADTGHSLCGTRCNALSADYMNITMPGGWRLIKVKENSEITVLLESPFMKGECVCTADEYTVQLDELGRPK